MPTARKMPHRTAERILDVALALFNRFGEPNASTTLIATEMGISPGNLHYHYPAKEQLVNGLLDRYERLLNELRKAAEQVSDVEEAWLFFHMLFELIWQYRFLYRDLNDLLSKNRRLETHFQAILANKSRAVRRLLDTLCQREGAHGRAGRGAHGSMPVTGARDMASVATAMVVVLTYWLSFAYVRDPRHALEPGSAGPALLRGAYHLLSLLSPYLDDSQREHFAALRSTYRALDERS